MQKFEQNKTKSKCAQKTVPFENKFVIHSCLPFYTRAVKKKLDDFQNDLNNLMSLHIHTPNIPRLIEKTKGKSIQTLGIFSSSKLHQIM